MNIKIEVSPISNGNIPLKFLHFAVRNYLSARVLYLEGQAYDAGVMAHEAIEKVMKSLILYKGHSKKLSSIHDLNALRNILNYDYGYTQLAGEKKMFKYYEQCYRYRYPDNKQPDSFSTGTKKVHLLDEVFFYFHEECLKHITVDKDKYFSGVFNVSASYFLSGQRNDLRKVLEENLSITIEYIDKAKKFWHSKGIFVKDEKGFYIDAYDNALGGFS